MTILILRKRKTYEPYNFQLSSIIFVIFLSSKQYDLGSYLIE